MAGVFALGPIGLHNGCDAPHAGLPDAVESGDGEVFGDAHAVIVGVLHGAERHGVGGAQDCGDVRVVGEEFSRSGVGGLGRVGVPFDNGNGVGGNTGVGKYAECPLHPGSLHMMLRIFHPFGGD